MGCLYNGYDLFHRRGRVGSRSGTYTMYDRHDALEHNHCIPIIQLNMISDQERIDKLVDQENSSGWPLTKAITPFNKTQFLEGLVTQEVLTKGDVSITAFGRGLEEC